MFIIRLLVCLCLSAFSERQLSSLCVRFFQQQILEFLWQTPHLPRGACAWIELLQQNPEHHFPLVYHQPWQHKHEVSRQHGHLEYLNKDNNSKHSSNSCFTYNCNIHHSLQASDQVLQLCWGYLQSFHLDKFFLPVHQVDMPSLAEDSCVIRLLPHPVPDHSNQYPQYAATHQQQFLLWPQHSWNILASPRIFNQNKEL